MNIDRQRIQDQEAAFLSATDRYADFLKNLKHVNFENRAASFAICVKEEYYKSLPYDAYLNTKHWEDTRANAMNRNGAACIVCGHEGHVDVHHSTYEHLGNPSEYFYCFPMCKQCHENMERAKTWSQGEIAKKILDGESEIVSCIMECAAITIARFRTLNRHCRNLQKVGTCVLRSLASYNNINIEHYGEALRETMEEQKRMFDGKREPERTAS